MPSILSSVALETSPRFEISGNYILEAGATMNSLEGVADVGPSQQPAAHTGWSGHADGQSFAAVLDAGGGRERVRRPVHQAGAAARGGPDTLSGSRRNLRARRPPLPASPRGPDLRFCGAVRPSLQLSWMAFR